VPAFAPLIDQAVESGIPVFTTNTDVEGSKRFGTYHTDWDKEGRQAAQAVSDFFTEKGVELKSVMLTTGAVDQPWAQDRMNGFKEELESLVPGVKFENSPSDALNTGFDAGQVYSQVRAFLQGHPDVQVVYQTDVNAGAVNKAIADLKRSETTWSAGHNVSEETLDSIEGGAQIVTIDQQFPAQAGWAAHACAAYLATGEILPNDNEAAVVTAGNIDESRAAFEEATGGTSG
jgi:ABC-type sugar transport system substrate-binding protein